jgi:hypothetical protein
MTEFKVGDKVRVRATEHNREELHGLEGEVMQISGPPKPVVYVMLSNHSLTSEGYPADYWWGFSSWSGCTVFDRLEQISSSSVGVGRLEKPCQVCKRNNDLDTIVCWCCGNQPF